MNDDELGRALGTALAAPELRAAPGAGAALRARARRERGRQVALAVTAAVAVAAVTVGLVRWVPAPATTAAVPPDPTAPAPAGPLFLATPLTVRPTAEPCESDPGAKCPLPSAVTVDEVRAAVATGGVLRLTLTTPDYATVAGIAGSGPATTVEVLVRGRPALGGKLTPDGLEVRTPDAPGTLAALGPYAPPPPRTGSGPLGVPLEFRPVSAGTRAGPCHQAAAGPGTLVVDRAGECLVLGGPGVTLRSADLQLAGPDAGTAGWRVVVGIPAGQRAAFAAWTRAQVGRRIAFVVGGVVVSGTPVVEGAISESVELAVDDRESAEAVVARLRP